MTYLILGLILFFVLHLVPTSLELKERLISRLGDNGYKGLFSLLSIAGLILMVWGYGEARLEAPQIWQPPSWMPHVTALFMLPVFPLLVAFNLPGQLKKKIPHPFLMAVKIWAFAHLLSNGDAASILLFGTFLVYAVYDLISAKKRAAARAVTVKTGPARNDKIALAAGLAIYALFAIWGHPLLIGVPAIPA